MAEQEFPFRYTLPVDSNVGRRVDGHVVQSLIARGGMGAAYLATHETLPLSKCVIKLMLAEIACHPQAIARIQREARALSMVQHDNIVKLQNFGVLDDGQLYLRFEFIVGKTLDRYVIDQGGRLPLRKAAYIIFQVCGAFDYAHKLGVIHRDLKPDNLMVESSPPGSVLKARIKVLDFGIAKVAAGAGELTGTGAIVGTARFMAPEQATNAAAVSGKADVFSLAQILYLLLTGTMPWGIPDSDVAIYHRQLTQAPALPPESLVPPAVAKVLLRGLSINPEDRPTMHEFAIELACAIPAEGDGGLESGTEILKKVVPDWVTSSPHDAQTLPHPVAVDPTVTPVPPQVAGDAGGDASALVPHPAPSAPDLIVTAIQRPRAATLASVAGTAAGSSVGGPSAPVRAPEPPAAALVATAVGQAPRRPLSPVLAALPTGLVSQGFAAQEPPGESREPQVVVASEIELAAGTPGPQPYAHAELPAVLVSHTFSGLTWQARVPSAQPSSHPEPLPSAQSPSHPDPPPMVVLPGTSRPTSSRTFAVVGAVALALAAVVCLAVVRQGSDVTHVKTSGAAETSGSARGSGSAPGLASTAMDAGTAAPQPRHAAETSPGQVMDTGRPSSIVGAAPRDAAVDAAPALTDRETATPGEAQRLVQRRAPPAAPPHGTLHIEVDPWADVAISGLPRTYTTPVTVALPTGQYRLVLTKGKNLTATVDVTIKPGETTNVRRSW